MTLKQPVQRTILVLLDITAQFHNLDDDDSYDDDMEDEEENESDESDEQPILFRECLRLLDAALTINHQHSAHLPKWCGSGSLGVLQENPMILIHGYRRPLTFPLDKSEATRIIVKAEPFQMKSDFLEGVSVRFS